jgi:Raf kinase inhibitor-like YbhB/YbcL family protein
MRISTDAIDGGFFDPRYTCDIDNSSPELRWENPPPGCRGYALLAEALDTPDTAFPHWVVYNIPVSVSHLPAGIPPQDTLPNGIRQGLNGFGKLGYYGPCPPRGAAPQRYRFRLLALSDLPEAPSRCTRDQLLALISPLVLQVSEIVGKYQRSVERAG